VGRAFVSCRLSSHPSALREWLPLDAISAHFEDVWMFADRILVGSLITSSSLVASHHHGDGGEGGDSGEEVRW
jgi:hypothetical protein